MYSKDINVEVCPSTVTQDKLATGLYSSNAACEINKKYLVTKR